MKLKQKIRRRRRSGGQDQPARFTHDLHIRIEMGHDEPTEGFLGLGWAYITITADELNHFRAPLLGVQRELVPYLKNFLSRAPR